DSKVFLFDYPSQNYLPKGSNSIIKNTVKDKDLYVFISHGHPDHFSSTVQRFENDTRDVHYVISDDIHTDISTADKAVKVSPESDYNVDDIDVHTYQSNDEGVAFLIQTNGKTIYFGGDLAKWNWPEWSESKRQEHVKVFDRVLEKLKSKNPHIAFSNMDERLPSWAGPMDFIEKVQPRFFVPIHTFGHTEWIDDLLEKSGSTKTEIITYKKTGDKTQLEI
ncbi:MAG: hypothetical protein R6U61_03325, partial [Thermoplasmata archaeon]